MTAALRDWWLPAGIDPQEVFAHRSVEVYAGNWRLEQARPTAAGLTRLIGALRQARERLASRSVASIVASLDAVSAAWLEPDLLERRTCIDALHHASGFSPEMVAHAIDLEMASSRSGDMMRALERELRDPRALDGFVDDAALGGRAHVVGPGLIGAIFSSNIPALPHLTVMRALLVKSACLGRSSRDEPVFLPLYLGTLARIDPELAACVAVVHWPREDLEVEAVFLHGIDHLIAYGNDPALEALEARCPRRLRTTWHGHRLGLAVVLRSALEEPAALPALARALAYDFTVFEQHACLAPQAVFVERGGAVRIDAFADALAGEMEAWMQALPARRLGVAQLGQRRVTLSMLELRQAMGDATRLVTPPDRLQGIVVIEPPEPLRPCILDRFVRILPVDDWSEIPPLLEPSAGRLQNAAVAGVGPSGEALYRALARLGCSRICPPGQMGTPSMMWQHDGHPRLGELVRWCDLEHTPPGEGLIRRPSPG